MSEKSLSNYDDIDEFRNISPTIEKLPEVYKPWKVFLNNVDMYHSKYIAAFITDQVYGMSRLLRGSGGEEAAANEEEPVPIQNLLTERYQVIGSLTHSYRSSSEDIKSLVSEDDENFRGELLKCGVIIYDITRNPAEIDKALKTLNILVSYLEEIKAIGPKTYDSFEEKKIFVLISPMMTWGLTKPLDPGDPDLPFSEVDYRKRRPHPNYKSHYTCEKEVIKIGKAYFDKLKTYVICTGLTYGEEQDDLEFFYKMAWHNDVIPIFGQGNNRIPFIHVRDLAKTVHGVIEYAPKKPQYILAVEQTPTTFKQFAKSLSKALSDGKTMNVRKEEAFLYPNMTQSLYDRFMVNVNMEPVFIVENLQLQWQNEANIAENMNQIVKEFKETRKLKPIKIIMHGPPGAGKTKLALRLCEYYKCKYVRNETMLEDFLQIWRDALRQAEQPKEIDHEYLGEEGGEEEAGNEDDPETLLQQIREVEVMKEQGSANLPDSYITGLLRNYLARNFCQNRGYILDDYPLYTEQARELFGQAQEAYEGEEEDVAEPVDLNKILPDLIVGLVASDEFITNRIMRLPELVIRGTPFAEENILERLAAYRELDSNENTVLNYFDELEIDIILLEVKTDDNDEEYALVVDKVGPQITFGLTLEEEEELHRLEEEAERLRQEKLKLSKEQEWQEAEEARKRNMIIWAETLERLKAEEEKILVAQSEPLRHYLMKYVFPTLTKGLVELATIKPEDPVDFLAEYLFKENPEGQVFDPSYNVECEDMYGHFKTYIEKIIDENEALRE